jgi:hypothetical protein
MTNKQTNKDIRSSNTEGRGGQKHKKVATLYLGGPISQKQLCFYIVQTFFSDEVLKETAFLFFCPSAEGKVRLLWQVL